MQRYQLRIAGHGAGDGRIVEFESQDTAGALNVLSTMEVGPRAELWQDDNFICSIQKDAAGEGVWAVSPTKSTGSPQDLIRNHKLTG